MGRPELYPSESYGVPWKWPDQSPGTELRLARLPHGGGPGGQGYPAILIGAIAWKGGVILL